MGWLRLGGVTNLKLDERRPMASIGDAQPGLRFRERSGTEAGSFDSVTVGGVELEQAIRDRRTHKAYGPEPVDSQTLDHLLELARWAPNHHLTNPWRFRVLGPESLARLKTAAPRDAAGKLDRAPTLVCASVVLSGDVVQDEEDLCAAACAVYIVLLAAHAHGLAGYWRTPGILRTPDGARAIGMGEDELFIALIHLGRAREEKRAPERVPPADFVTYLP